MGFDSQDWRRRVRQAKTGEELNKLLDELPLKEDRSSTSEDVPDVSTTAPTPASSQ